MKGILIPAHELRAGDIITALNDTRVASVEVLDDRVVVETTNGWPGFYPLESPVRVVR